jgi:hypothetical protein
LFFDNYLLESVINRSMLWQPSLMYLGIDRFFFFSKKKNQKKII